MARERHADQASFTSGSSVKSPAWTLPCRPTPETIDAVEAAMAQYAVCVIRDASLKDEDHIRFSRAFGPLELPPPGRQAHRAGTLRHQQSHARWRDQAAESGADRSPSTSSASTPTARSTRCRPSGRSCSATSCRRRVPTPSFVDTRAVYEDLPQAMKERIEALRPSTTCSARCERTGVKFGDEQMRKSFPSMAHPLVRLSANGRKTLYLGWHAVGIVGWSEAEAQALLDELFAIRDPAQVHLFAPVAARRHDHLGQPLHHAQRHVLRTLSLQARHAPHDDQRIRTRGLHDRDHARPGPRRSSKPLSLAGAA